jgi:hypothetical protein
MSAIEAPAGSPYRLSDWQYRKAKKKENGGVLINLSPSGAVEIREGLVKHEIERETEDAIGESYRPGEGEGRLFRAPLPVYRPSQDGGGCGRASRQSAHGAGSARHRTHAPSKAG